MLAAFETWNSAIDAWFGALGPPLEGLARLILAAFFGALVGLEREVRGRQAGFRTCLLVCLGSAMVMLVSIQFAHHRWTPQPGINVNVDPARIAYGVMTGVGFLGAGVIVRNQSGTVRGLTTAAGLWCVAAIGLGIGFGMYTLAAFGTGLVVLALWLLDYIAASFPRARYRAMTVRVRYRAGCMEGLAALLQKSGLKVSDVGMRRVEEDPTYADVRVNVSYIDAGKVNDAERAIEADPELRLMSMSSV